MQEIATHRPAVNLRSPRIASRQRVIDLPNFRDHGRTVDRPLLELLGHLSDRHGQSFASEGGIRRMIFEDTGHMPGVGTIAKALERLGEQGLLAQLWLVPGQILPDNNVCTHGTRLIWLSKNRRQRYATKRFNREQKRRLGHRNRNVGFDVRKLSTLGMRPVPSAAAMPDETYRERSNREIERLRELEKGWLGETEKPPPKRSD